MIENHRDLLLLLALVVMSTNLWLQQATSACRIVVDRHDKELAIGLHATAAHLDRPNLINERLLQRITDFLPLQGFQEWLTQAACSETPECIADTFSRKKTVVKNFFSEDEKRIVQWFSCFSMKGITHFRKGAKAVADYALAERDTVRSFATIHNKEKSLRRPVSELIGCMGNQQSSRIELSTMSIEMRTCWKSSVSP